MQLAKALLLLPFLAVVDGCAGRGDHCSFVNGCCGSLHCEKQGFLNWRCTGAEQCKAEGQTCDGPGLAQKSCCHGMKCERHLLGTTNKQCVKAEPQCMHRGQICGCAGCLTQQCCGGAHCLDVGGQGGKKYCVNTGASFAEENSTKLAEGQAVNVLENSTELAEGQEQCKAQGQTCDGPGLAPKSCCHGMKCERHLMGTTNKQCVKAEPQCMHQGQICGCAGCLTQQCCGGAHCLDVGGQGGKKYCVNTGAASFAEENSTKLAEGQAVNVLENSTGPAEFLP